MPNVLDTSKYKTTRAVKVSSIIIIIIDEHVLVITRNNCNVSVFAKHSGLRACVGNKSGSIKRSIYVYSAITQLNAETMSTLTLQNLHKYKTLTSLYTRTFLALGTRPHNLISE